MPLELTQSRVQKIWIPVDHRPSLPRCECRGARGGLQGSGGRSEAIVRRALAGRFCADSAPARSCGAGPCRAPSVPLRRSGRGWRRRRAGTPRLPSAAARCCAHPAPRLAQGPAAGRAAQGPASESLGFGAWGKGRPRVPRPGPCSPAPAGLHARAHLASLPSFLGLTPPLLSLPRSPLTSISIACRNPSPPFRPLSYLCLSTSSQPRFLCFSRISPPPAFLSSFLYVSYLLSTLYISLSSPFPSLSSLPPPGAVLGGSSLGTKPLRPFWEGLWMGDWHSWQHFTRVRTHAPPCLEFAGSPPPCSICRGPCMHALERFTSGSREPPLLVLGS